MYACAYLGRANFDSGDLRSPFFLAVSRARPFLLPADRPLSQRFRHQHALSMLEAETLRHIMPCFKECCGTAGDGLESHTACQWLVSMASRLLLEPMHRSLLQKDYYEVQGWVWAGLWG